MEKKNSSKNTEKVSRKDHRKQDQSENQLSDRIQIGIRVHRIFPLDNGAYDFRDKDQGE